MEKVDILAKKLWNYHQVYHALKKSDCIFILCSHDTRIAERGAQLFLEGWAPYIIISGGSGKLTKHLFDKPEAEIFAEVAIKMGVPKDKIIIESKSTNTGENVSFTKELLRLKNLDPQTFILVQKPYMERRALATFSKVWPEKEFVVTSPEISYEEYPDEIISKDLMINLLVGDLQRIKVYPSMGFQISQAIPDEVWRAYEELISMGYTGHLIK